MIVFDPYFVMYPHLVTLAGGTTVYVDTYPDFGVDVDRLRAALTPRTKAILLNSPANPTGRVYPREQVRAVAELARERGILLISDEIYRVFCYDAPFTSAAEFNPDVLVLDGFSKAYGMTGWRLGFAHGPRRLIEEMTKLQQFTFVCAPSMVQHAGVAALDYDVSGHVADYRRKRDRVYDGIKDRYEVAKAEGAFYLFPKAPHGTGNGVRRGGHPQPTPRHSGIGLQPARHAFPPQLRRRRKNVGPRRRDNEPAGAVTRFVDPGNWPASQTMGTVIVSSGWVRLCASRGGSPPRRGAPRPFPTGNPTPRIRRRTGGVASAFRPGRCVNAPDGASFGAS